MSIPILLLILVISYLIYNEFETYKCWGLKLPGIQKSIVLFSDLFQDGDQILVVKYYSKAKMKKMIEINNLELISSENIQDIQDNLLDFYNRLGTNVKGISGKEVYDENIDEKKLLSTNNYYLIKRKHQNRSYIILILDIEDKKLYTFSTVR